MSENDKFEKEANFFRKKTENLTENLYLCG